MQSSVQLVSGPLRCELCAALGASVAGLWHDDVPVLRSTASGQSTDVRQSGCYPLVPYSNRIADALLSWHGALHPLARNFAPEPHAIHGVGWQRPWELREAGASFARMALEHRPDAHWPFAFSCEQAFRLTPGALEVTLRATNRAEHAAPIGLGWHPFFVKRPGSQIRFAATGRWEMGADKLPTVRRDDAGLAQCCDRLDVDHCFDGWDGIVELRDAQMALRLHANLDRLVVYTNARQDFIAIEPVSHVNNALTMARGDARRLAELGVRCLQPGESWSARMRIETGSTP